MTRRADALPIADVPPVPGAHPTAGAGGGRPRRTGALAVGVDIGGTKVLTVLVDEQGVVLAERRRPLPTQPVGRTPPTRVGPEHRAPVPPGAAISSHAVRLPALVAAVADDVAAVIGDTFGAEEEARTGHDARHGTPMSGGTEGGGVGADLAGVGVGVAGLVDGSGRVLAAPHLRGVEGPGLAEALGQVLGRPVVVGNDATCAAVAEHWRGAARDADDAVVVTVGTGIGAGLVVGGRIVHGGHGFAGEPGHQVVDPLGPACPCGRRGCWERVASGSALGAAARQAAAGGDADALVALAGGDPLAIRGEHVMAAAVAGDRTARGLVADLAHWLAVGLANLVVVVDPAIVVLAGGLSAAGPLLIDAVEAALAAPGVLPVGWPLVPVVPAVFGPAASAVGAAAVAAGFVQAGSDGPPFRSPGTGGGVSGHGGGPLGPVVR